jgi:hypothetical protein
MGTSAVRAFIRRSALWAAVAVGSIVSLAACGDAGGEDRVTVGQAPVESSADVLAGRYVASYAWVGDRILVYGGNEVLDGPGMPGIVGSAALIDPRSGEAATVEAPPFEYPLEPGSNVMATAGSSVVLIGVLCAERLADETDGCEPGDMVAAEYSIEERSWQEIGLPDALAGSQNLVGELLGVTSSDEVVFALRDGGHREADESPYWTFDPDTDRWTPVQAPGVRVEDDCLAGDRLAVLTGSRVSGDTVVATPTETSSAGVLNDPEVQYLDLGTEGAEWEATSGARGSAYPDKELVCGSDFVLLHDGIGLEVLVTTLNAGAEWSNAPSTPSQHGFAKAVRTGDRVLLAGLNDGIGYSFSPTAAAWEEVSFPPGAEDAIWTGDELIVISPNAQSGLTAIEVPS